MTKQSIIERLSAYIVAAGDIQLPQVVSEKAKHHILDTISAMVSGSRLKPGELAIRFIQTQGGTSEAKVIGTDFLTTAINAAMVNGYMAHADETDDSHAPSLTHPGCAIVPAALAMAERQNASGEAFLRAVVLGYDVSARIAGVMRREGGHSSHAIGPMFGGTAAAASLAKLDARQVCHALAYTGQQASGIRSWVRDEEHIEKAFVFGGMGARNGVSSVLFVQSGFTGESDIFSGDDNFLELFCPRRDELPESIDSLGSRYEISFTNIKRFYVGSPIQAAADAMVALVQDHGLTADNVVRIDVHLPPLGAKTVNNRSMPDINCQYIMAVILLDGRLTFAAAHSYERMSNPQIRDVESRIHLIADPQFSEQEAQRPGLVRIQLANGQTVEKLVQAVRGTVDNPMIRDEVEEKASDLTQGILGAERANSLITTIWSLEKVGSVRELRPLLSA